MIVFNTTKILIINIYFLKCLDLYEAQGINPNESQSVTQCPFLEFIKPTLKEANPEVVQDIFEQKKQKHDSGLKMNLKFWTK